MIKKVSALLVLHAMAEQNDDVLAFPLNTNFKYARTGKDGWGEITIAVSNHVIANMDSYVGSLYMANQAQYATLEQALQDNDICPDCDGSGEVAGDYFSDDGMSVCPHCGGKGGEV
jgi:DnaJ-class molecular chaperone